MATERPHVGVSDSVISMSVHWSGRDSIPLRGLLAGPGVGTVAITQSERASVAALREFAALLRQLYFVTARLLAQVRLVDRVGAAAAIMMGL
jgi:hypothetical protein